MGRITSGMEKSVSVKKIAIFAALILAGSMVYLDQTIVPIALPSIQEDLKIPYGSMYWVVNAYQLAGAIFFILGGKCSDVFGHKKIFQIGLLFFGFASLLCGLSNSELTLAVTRFLQGVGAAFLLPSVPAIILDTFPRSSAGKAMGIQIGISSLFLVLGPFVGGVLTQYASWRYIFFLNIPFVLAAFFLAQLSIPKSPRHASSVDFPGFMLFVIAMLTLTYPLMEIPYWGWLSTKTLLLLGASILFFILLYTLSKQLPHPMLDLALFKKEGFSSGVLIVFVIQFTLCLAVFWPVFLQKVVKLTPTETGLLMLLSVIPAALAAPLSGKICDSKGAKVAAKYGFLSLVLSLVWSLFALPSLNIWLILVGMLFLSFGIPFVSTSTGITAIASVDGHKKGHASGLYQTIRFGGATFAVAFIGTLITVFQKLFFTINLQYVGSGVNPNRLIGIYGEEAQAKEAFAQLSSSVQASVLDALQSATSYAYSAATIFILAITLCTLILLPRLYRHSS